MGKKSLEQLSNEFLLNQARNILKAPLQVAFDFENLVNNERIISNNIIKLKTALSKQNPNPYAAPEPNDNKEFINEELKRLNNELLETQKKIEEATEEVNGVKDLAKKQLIKKLPILNARLAEVRKVEDINTRKTLANAVLQDFVIMDVLLYSMKKGGPRTKLINQYKEFRSSIQSDRDFHSNLVKARKATPEQGKKTTAEQTVNNLLLATGQGSLLHLALKRGDSKKAIELIKAGANLNAIDSDGNTALHIAAENGDIKLQLALLKAGTDLFKQNSAGETPWSLMGKERQKTITNFVENSLKSKHKGEQEIFSKINLDIFNYHFKYKRALLFAEVEIVSHLKDEESLELAASKAPGNEPEEQKITTYAAFIYSAIYNENLEILNREDRHLLLSEIIKKIDAVTLNKVVNKLKGMTNFAYCLLEDVVKKHQGFYSMMLVNDITMASSVEDFRDCLSRVFYQDENLTNDDRQKLTEKLLNKMDKETFQSLFKSPNFLQDLVVSSPAGQSLRNAVISRASELGVAITKIGNTFKINPPRPIKLAPTELSPEGQATLAAANPPARPTPVREPSISSDDTVIMDTNTTVIMDTNTTGDGTTITPADLKAAKNNLKPVPNYKVNNNNDLKSVLKQVLAERRKATKPEEEHQPVSPSDLKELGGHINDEDKHTDPKGKPGVLKNPSATSLGQVQVPLPRQGL